MEKLKKYLYGAGLIFVITLILLTLSITINQFSQRNYIGLENARSIDVSAEEIIYETPDEAEIVFSVVTQGESYAQATEENNIQMNEVNEYLKGEGIKDDDLRTENFSVSPRYEQIEQDRRTTREIVGYEVENNLRVTAKNLDEIDSLISGAINAGANKVSGLQFVVSNEDALQKEVRSKAIIKAQEEAQKIANDLGVQLGRVLDFSQSQRFYPQRSVMQDMAMEVEEAADTPIEPGETEISSSVNITFEIR